MQTGFSSGALLGALVWVLAPGPASARGAPTCEHTVQVLDRAAANSPPCLTVPLHRAVHAAREGGFEACLDQALVARGLPAAAGAPRRPVVPPPAAPDDKEVRDALGEFPHAYETENFVLKWGEGIDLSEARVEEIGEHFEAAWAAVIEAWGYPLPIGTETYKLNVYVADSGEPSPSSHGAAAYTSVDPDGMPMIVLNKALVTALSRYLPTTSVHEFFHACQRSADTYVGGYQSGWYFEATATWASEELYPDSGLAVEMLPAVAFLPELPINLREDEDGDEWVVAHEYGAFIFPRYLTEWVAGPELVLHSWVEASSSDPLQTLDGLLAGHDTDVREAFFGFAAHNATWDYASEALYEDKIDDVGGWMCPESHRPCSTIVTETDGWHEASRHLPHTLGANYWALWDLLDSTEVSFAGDGGVDWYAAVATQTGAQHARHPLPLVDGAGTLTVEGLAEVDEAWLVVAAVGGFLDHDEAHGYGFEVTGVVPPPPPEERGVCGCGAGPGPVRPLLALLGAAALLIRRRQRSLS